MTQQRKHERAARKLHALLKFVDGLRIHSLLFVGEAEIAVRRK